MKQAFYFMFTVFLLLAGLVGCAPDEQPADEENQGEEQQGDEQQGDNEEDENATEGKTERPQFDDVVAAIKDEMELGLTKDEVRELFGEPNAERTTNEDIERWRYDFGKEEYEFESKIMAVDAEGLQNGNMTAQMIVEYGDDDTVDSYIGFYLKDGQIMQYRVNEEGETEEPANDV